jgi:DNA-binding MarR family transcriptional regulator
MVTKAELASQTIDIFWSTFPGLWHKVRAYVRATAVEQFDITPGQFHTLRRIHSGRNSVSKLADAKHISRAAISRSVEVLVTKGWVTRTTNPDDRRNVVLALTGEGKTLLKSVFNNIGSWMEAQLITLDEGELENINQALLTLKSAFDQTSKGE